MIRRLKAKLLHWIDPEPEVVVNADLLREMLKDNEVYKRMTIAKLKPCPFCGGAASVRYHEGVKKWFVGCDNYACRIQPFTDLHVSKSVVVREWNRRASDE